MYRDIIRTIRSRWKWYGCASNIIARNINVSQYSLFNQQARAVERAAVRKQVKRIMSEKHIERNRIAAAVILGDVEKHGGEQSGLVRWARAFTAREGA